MNNATRLAQVLDAWADDTVRLEMQLADARGERDMYRDMTRSLLDALHRTMKDRDRYRDRLHAVMQSMRGEHEAAA